MIKTAQQKMEFCIQASQISRTMLIWSFLSLKFPILISYYSEHSISLTAYLFLYFLLHFACYMKLIVIA